MSAPTTPDPQIPAVPEKPDPLRHLDLTNEQVAKALANWLKKMLAS